MSITNGYIWASDSAEQLYIGKWVSESKGSIPFATLSAKYQERFHINLDVLPKLPPRYNESEWYKVENGMVSRV